MKTHGLFAAALLGVSGTLWAQAPVIPQPRPPERYAKLGEVSPFALATVELPPADEPKKIWADNLYVTGLGKDYVNGKEEVFVSIKSRGEQTAFSLYGSEPGYDGIAIGNVVWSDQVGKSKVTLRKGVEFATIEFDPQVIQTPIAAAQPVPMGGPGGVQNPRVNRPVRPVVPGAGAGLNSQIPRPPAALPSSSNNGVMLPQPVLPAGGPTNGPAENRQRVRVIKTNP